MTEIEINNHPPEVKTGGPHGPDDSDNRHKQWIPIVAMALKLGFMAYILKEFFNLLGNAQ